MKTSVFGLIAILGLSSFTTNGQSAERPRTIVTTDGEVDDQDSFIRLLLYSNEFDLLGLVYSSSQWHYKGDGKGTTFISEMESTKSRYGERTELRWPGTTWMQECIDRYATVYNNLIKHARGYPTPDHLKSIVKVGNIDFEGEMANDTEGSDLIKAILLDNSNKPVYLQIWGGTNTVARALKSIEDEYKNTPNWHDVQKKVSEKAIIYAVLDQDNTYHKYIEPNWPKVKVLYNASQFWNFAYPWTRMVPDQLQQYLEGSWFKKNIKFDHGELLSHYYLWGDGTAIQNDPEHDHGDTVKMYQMKMDTFDFISEGDSPAFLHLIDVGLDNLSDASYGGWGGRMVRSTKNPYRWEDGEMVTDFNPYTNEDDPAYPLTRWIGVLQNDFAARADWCVMPFEKANHPPVVVLRHANSLSGKRGSLIRLIGFGSDPDGNTISYKWWQYHEVDTYGGKVEINDSNMDKASFTIPKNAKVGDTIHIILEVSDSGIPKLTRYQRVIVKVAER